MTSPTYTISFLFSIALWIFILLEYANAAKPADFTGDGTTDLALWEPSSGNWYVKTTESAGPNHTCPPCFSYYGYGGCVAQWGLPGDTPRSADFDNDNKVDMAVWRPNTKTFWVRLSNPVYGGCAVAEIAMGTAALSTDRPDAADATGDGFADVMLFRRTANGEKWVVRNGSNQKITTFNANHLANAFETPFATVSADYQPDQVAPRVEGARFENINGYKLWTITQFLNYPQGAEGSWVGSNSHVEFAPADPDEVATRGQWGGAPAVLFD